MESNWNQLNNCNSHFKVIIFSNYVLRIRCWHKSIYVQIVSNYISKKFLYSYFTLFIYKPAWKEFHIKSVWLFIKPSMIKLNEEDLSCWNSWCDARSLKLATIFRISGQLIFLRISLQENYPITVLNIDPHFLKKEKQIKQSHNNFNNSWSETTWNLNSKRLYCINRHYNLNPLRASYVRTIPRTLDKITINSIFNNLLNKI